jgi:hypothetical protein
VPQAARLYLPLQQGVMAPLTVAVPTPSSRRRADALARFRAAVSAVVRILGGARALAGAAEEASSSAEAAAFLRRAASFGIEDPGCDSAAAEAGHPHRPAYHLMPVRASARCGALQELTACFALVFAALRVGK